MPNYTTQEKSFKSVYWDTVCTRLTWHHHNLPWTRRSLCECLWLCKCHFWGLGQLTLNDNETIHENSMFMTRVAAVLHCHWLNRMKAADWINKISYPDMKLEINLNHYFHSNTNTMMTQWEWLNGNANTRQNKRRIRLINQVHCLYSCVDQNVSTSWLSDTRDKDGWNMWTCLLAF